MGEANEGRRKGTEVFSLQTENYPRDLLHRFIFSNASKSEFVEVKEEEEGSEDVELNLGLSMGGRFGVDKNSKKLIRSSSIAGTITIVRRDEAFNQPAVGFPALIRASSLPTETEEEWRKRKELQSLRRMEAKRRRSEKQRSKEGVVAAVAGRYSEEGRPEIEGLEEVNCGEKKGISLAVEENLVGLTVESRNRAAATKQALFGGIDVGKKGRSSFMVGLGHGHGHGDGEGAGRPISQGSTESQGGSLSEMSELENKPPTGSNSHGEARSSSSTLTLQKQGSGEAGGSNKNENSSKVMTNMSCKQDSVNSRGRGRERGANSVEDMPCVFTVGDGPNGRRVEGILYKYGKGEEVRIMCVCHGTFLSPAEFVKHAGGGDVANPLRHIVVHPRSSLFL